MMTSTARTQGMTEGSASTHCRVAASGKARRALTAGHRIGCVLALVITATVAMVVWAPTAGSAESTRPQAWPAWEITYRTPGDVQYDHVYDVSCVASGYCMQQPLRVLDGSGWQAIPAAPGDVLGVACVATADCFGVGARLEHAGTRDQVSHVGIFRWNGSAWTDESIPDPAGAMRAWLASISCATPTSCVAIGVMGTAPDGPTSGYAAHWNGTVWTPMPAPPLAAPALGRLKCFGVDRCVARDEATNQIAVLNGTAWTVSDVPVSPGYGFRSVGCWTATGCIAVATNGDSAAQSFVWNGTTWSRAPDVTGSIFGVDLQCFGPNDCLGVGDVESRWNGSSWSSASLPDALAWRDFQKGGLDLLSCLSPTACVAAATVDSLGFSGSLVAMTTPLHLLVAGSTVCRSSLVVDLSMFLQRPTSVGGFQLADAANGEVFVTATAGDVRHRYLQDDGQPLYDWTTLGAPNSGAAGAVQVGLNRQHNQEVFVRTGAGDVAHKYATPGVGTGWSDWATLGTPLGGSIVTFDGDVHEGVNYLGNEELFALASDGNVYHDFATPGHGTGWSGWDTMGKPPIEGTTLDIDIQVGQNYLCNQEVYATDAAGTVWHTYATPGRGTGWSGWSSMGAPPGGALGPAMAGQNAAGNQELFAVAADGSVWHDWSTPGTGSGWSEWSSLGTLPTPAQAGSLVVDTYPVEQLTVTTTNGTYLNIATPGVGSGWTGWTPTWK